MEQFNPVKMQKRKIKQEDGIRTSQDNLDNPTKTPVSVRERVMVKEKNINIARKCGLLS